MATVNAAWAKLFVPYASKIMFYAYFRPRRPSESRKTYRNVRRKAYYAAHPDRH